VGPGRSGTSAIAGALAHSGYHVPAAIQGRKANPRGFYEPRWLVNFDKERLRAARVGTLDPDPHALDFFRRAVDWADAKAVLAPWITEQLATGQRLVLKDPRLIWFHQLWAELAEELCFDLGFLMMMRHPSEVSSSRSTHYDAAHARAVAGWINVALMTERLTRGDRRAVIHYPDLVADWRRELGRVDGVLNLDLQPPLGQLPHPVDEFLDPALRRQPHGWADLSVPGWLRDLADRTFDALNTIAGHGEPASPAALDALAEEYADAYEALAAVARPRFQRVKGVRWPADPADDPAAEISAERRTIRSLLRRR
jgi:hypothetical protein